MIPPPNSSAGNWPIDHRGLPSTNGARRPPNRGWKMRGLKTAVSAMLTAGIVLSASPALAWDGVKTGKITGIDTTSGNNYGFRVWLDGTPMCGTAENWAYMNRNWDNYDATAALLTAAYLASKTVVIYTDKNGNYCQIGYVSFRQ